MLALGAGTAFGATTFKVATVSPDGSVWMKRLRAASKEVEAATEGRVKFRFFPGGIMGDDKAVLRKIRVGQLHGAVFTAGGLIPVYSDIQLYSMPLLFRSGAEATALRKQFDERVLKGLEDKGFVSFGIAEVGFAYALAQVPVRSVAEAGAQKVWSPDNDPGAARALEAFGISPIPLSIADVLAGLQTGLINSVAGPPVAAIALQWHTQVSHGLDLPLLYVYGLMTVSDRQFKKLSAADQAIVREVFGREVAAVDAGARQDHDKAKAALATQGIQWHRADAAQQAEWQSAADRANQRLVDEGFVSRELFEDFSAALKQHRDSVD